MKTPRAIESDDSAEIGGLIELLHRTEQRLEALTDGQVDSVANSEGRTLLLGRAQRLLRQAGAERQLAILNVLPANIAMLDARGKVLAVNAAWQSYGDANDMLVAEHGVGLNYLDVCEKSAIGGLAEARSIRTGVQDVLTGASERFSAEYSCHSPTEQRWYLMTVAPLSDTQLSGAIVMHMDITAGREAAESLRVSELRFRQMAETIEDVFFLRAADGSQWFYVSPAYEKVWGRACADLYLDPDAWFQSIYSSDRKKLFAKSANLRGEGLDYECRISRPDGTMRWVHVREFPVPDSAGNLYRIAGIASDVTARKASDDRIRRLNRVYAVLSGINNLIVRVNQEGELFHEACSITVDQGGFVMSWIGVVDRAAGVVKPVALAGDARGYFDIARLNLTDADGAELGPVGRAVNGLVPIISQNIKADFKKINLRSEQFERDINSFVIFPISIAGECVAVLALYARETDTFVDEEMRLLAELAADIGFGLDHIRKNDRLEYISYYDELTGLAKRGLFIERVAQFIRAAAGAGHELAVVLINLERFKNINDSLGRDAGDALLVQVGGWLTSYLGDASCVARVGGDHFALVMPKVTDRGEFGAALQTLTERFVEHPIHLDGAVFRVNAKHGIAFYPGDALDAETLFKNAEAALKVSSTRGDRMAFYAATMSAVAADNLTLENRLRHALDDNQFVLHYQPKFSLADRRLTGVEALIRWQDPELGLVPPGQFIPLLEETGLIHAVGAWALRRALEDHRRWTASGMLVPRVAVNVSPLQMRERNFVSELERQVRDGTSDPAALEIEITESVIMADIKHSVSTLMAVRAAGVTVAIDDFGTGFSSLSYLTKLPIDTLKIDRSFVVEMTVGAEGLAIVSAIISLAHALKLKVVAEGVETDEQARLLRLLGCDEFQGFLMSKPLPAALLEARYLTGREQASRKSLMTIAGEVSAESH